MPDSSTGRLRPPREPGTTAERECPRHGLTVFHRYASGQVRCKRCVGEAVTRRQRRVKASLVAEAGGACAICGYARAMRNLQFHHVDPATKSFAMTMARGKSLETYRAEAAKCVLVCANCHGEIEAGLIESPPAGARFADRVGA
jgi:hypothetical protein